MLLREVDKNLKITETLVNMMGSFLFFSKVNEAPW